jgi:hypothetical protein
MKYLIVACLFLAGCGGLVSNDLNKFFESEIGHSTSGIVDLRKFNCNGWDRLYILTPYAAPAGFDEVLLKNQKDILDTGIAESDSFFLVVLAHKDKVVRIAKFKDSGFSEMSLIKNNKFGYYTKSNAVFEFYQKSATDPSKTEIAYKHPAAIR